MRRLSIIRFREAHKLKEQRGLVIVGMDRLIRTHQHLKKEPPATENALAMEQIGAIIGTLEDENKDLAERVAVLWNAVLALDALELSNTEVLLEQWYVQDGYDYLERIRRRIVERLPLGELAFPGQPGPIGQIHWHGKGDAEDEEALCTLADLRYHFDARSAQLELKQEKYRWARAKALAGVGP